MRQALALATNREALVKEGLQGWGTPGNSPILPSSWAYAAQPWPHDPARAAQLLDGAGWQPDADGVRQRCFQIHMRHSPVRGIVAPMPHAA